MPGNGDGTKAISLFYSYSHKDEDLRLKLQDHLAPLKWSGMIAEWHDRKIEAGKEWEKEIDDHLSSADIILLLVSASFIASPYCWSVEISKALERHERGEARVIPVILRPCQWQRTSFAKLQFTPRDAKPVTAWPDLDTAFDDVVSKIGAVVDELQRSVSQPADAGALLTPPPEGLSTGTLLTPPPAFADFAVFRDIDAPWCPEMVVLPAGEFLMGSPESEEGRNDDEGPQRRVKISTRFAMSRYPVTVEQYRRFVEATDRRHEGGIRIWTGSEWKNDPSKSWSVPGFTQTDRHPTVGVSWQDATCYCAWLAKETGKQYRLPSEAEWEYACRAGTTTPYSFGETMGKKDANFDMNVSKTTEVGSFPPNPWGLYDMHGNVWEWVEDIWHGSYEGGPTESSAWTEGEGTLSVVTRVCRGGSWGYNQADCRSARRSWGIPTTRPHIQGFRVARMLP
jgi:formylglycine-generating enzyme required for sulfatase activity